MGKGPRRPRGRLQTWLSSSGAAFVDALQTVVALGGLLAVVALQIPWLQDPLERMGAGDGTAIALTVLMVVIVSLYYEVKGVGRRITRAEKAFAAPQTHFPDPMDVYPVLLDRIRSIRRDEDKYLDVIGMTLYTAWPTIRFWLARSEMSGWTIRLAAAVHTDEMPNCAAGLIPAEWFAESHANLAGIQAQQGGDGWARAIRLEAYGYDFMPVFHGFRLANGDLFYSVLHWQDDGKIGREGYSYEFISCEDHSPSAQALRGTFDSWFARCCRTPWNGAS
jgi:hypothetical protein